MLNAQVTAAINDSYQINPVSDKYYTYIINALDGLDVADASTAINNEVCRMEETMDMGEACGASEEQISELDIVYCFMSDIAKNL